MNNIYNIISNNYIRFLRFSLVGVLNTSIDLGVFSFLFLKMDVSPLPAHAAGFLVAVCNSFLLNSLWTFRSGQTQWQAAPRFFIVALGVLAVTSLIFWALKLYIPVMLAKVLVVVVSVFLGYYANRRFVFT